MTKLINGKTNENELNIIETSAYHEPELVLPNSFTALHIAYISWNLYSSSAPTCWADEFSIDESSDFAHYNIHDAKDISDHFYDCAFSIGENVKSNPQYSVQEAYDAAIDIGGDTVVREDVLSDVLMSIREYIKSGNKNMDEYIQEDYQMLSDQEAENKENEHAKLESKLEDLYAVALSDIAELEAKLAELKES